LKSLPDKKPRWYDKDSYHQDRRWYSLEAGEAQTSRKPYPISFWGGTILKVAARVAGGTNPTPPDSPAVRPKNNFKQQLNMS
jgi:hypothetical protein